MSRNGSIDVLRLLLAFIVVVNHTCIFGAKLQDTIDCAVPVFLMISGYYFYSNRMEEEIMKCRKSVAKLFSIMLGSVMLYVLWDVAKFQIWGEHTEYSIYTLFTCTNYFCPPLWYIHAMLYLYAFLYLIETTFKRLHIDFSLSRQPAILLVLAFITLRMLMGYYSSSHNIVLCLSFLILGLVQAKIKWSVRTDIALIWGGYYGGR